MGVSETARKKLFTERTRRWGRKIRFYLPGMFTLDGRKGCYPAVSLTGTDCELMCPHCRGGLLANMLVARDGDELRAVATDLSNRGMEGILLTGGCDPEGRLPLDEVMPAIAELKRRTGMYVSVHAGVTMTSDTALKLKEAGVDQALLDIVVDDSTAWHVWGVPSARTIMDSLETMTSAGLEVVPHVVVGMDRGRVRGEYDAIDFLRRFAPALLSVVVFMPHVAMKDVAPPPVEDVADVLEYARAKLPETELSLGCARPRGRYRYDLEEMALACGVTRMALWSDRALRAAKRLGLEPEYRYTCCSVDAPRNRGGDRTLER